MSYVITGLDVEPFKPLFGLADAALAEQGVMRMSADAPDSYPCRVTLRDAAPGATLLLLNYEHQSADTPFRARHAIFVDESATRASRYVDEIPPVLAHRRYISLRPFDGAGMMVDGVVAGGAELEPAIAGLLARPEVNYIQAHYAGRGCYAARIERG